MAIISVHPDRQTDTQTHANLTFSTFGHHNCTCRKTDTHTDTCTHTYKFNPFDLWQSYPYRMIDRKTDTHTHSYTHTFFLFISILSTTDADAGCVVLSGVTTSTNDPFMEHKRHDDSKQTEILEVTTILDDPFL